MTQPTQFILNGITSMEALLNNPTFIWKNETFACVPNTLNDSEKNIVAGLNENADFRMIVRLNQFTPNIYPEMNDYIIYQDYKLLIKGIKKPGHNVFWIYLCELPNIDK